MGTPLDRDHGHRAPRVTSSIGMILQDPHDYRLLEEFGPAYRVAVMFAVADGRIRTAPRGAARTTSA